MALVTPARRGSDSSLSFFFCHDRYDTCLPAYVDGSMDARRVVSVLLVTLISFEPLIIAMTTTVAATDD